VGDRPRRGGCPRRRRAPHPPPSPSGCHSPL